ncbi:unknown [Mycoplasma sp. CAG:611]|nr:unknown [Mycoplasma sp. CAG:611]
MKTKLKEKLEFSNEEVYCVYFYCEGELVIDDSDIVYGNKVVESVLINDNYKNIEVNYCR